MAFVRAQMERVAGGLQRLFIYDAGADAIATVDTDGYFDSMADELRQGDVIIVKSSGLTKLDNLMVTSATGAAATTTVGTEGLAAD